ncbi:MAG: type II toxin-antitoxin system RelE/ParE family toxin [Chthoniobacteraceae bacterium]
MGWQVAFSTRSRQDLQRIVEFIAKEDPAAAERFGLALVDRAESFAIAPMTGIELRERPGTRFFPVGSYLIIYRADVAKETVRILRFWHGARGKRPLR